MFRNTKNQSIPAFQTPFWSSALIGSTIATAFYFYLYVSERFHLLNIPVLIRYAKCHLVAEISVYMFLIAIVSIVQKMIAANRQSKYALASKRAIRELVQSAPQDRPIASADWLESMWKAQTIAVRNSWLGRRLNEVICRQTARGNCRHLEEDLRDLSDRDANTQHESYGLVRIISWAMPMFGFLGTVIGISETLGQMDTTKLASGSKEAMDSLTAGLYVAFDTTAVGLVLTMIAMFAMFGVGRVETKLLGMIDDEVADNLQGLLSEDESKPQDIYKVEQTVRIVTDQFLVAIERIVEKQTSLWKDSIVEAQTLWSSLVSSASDTTQRNLVEALDISLNKYAKSMDTAQLEGISQIDARYHQWQSTLSDQARTMHSHHGQLLRQTELLTELIDKSQALHTMEEGLQQNLTRLTDIDRFHEVAICLTEAVAVLGTQMERAGHLQVPKLRRVPNPPTAAENLRRAA